jgi:hypothetical protein
MWQWNGTAGHETVIDDSWSICWKFAAISGIGISLNICTVIIRAEQDNEEYRNIVGPLVGNREEPMGTMDKIMSLTAICPLGADLVERLSPG